MTLDPGEGASATKIQKMSCLPMWFLAHRFFLCGVTLKLSIRMCFSTKFGTVLSYLKFSWKKYLVLLAALVLCKTHNLEFVLCSLIMHSFSISQPIDGTCSLILLPETKSVVLSFFRHSWNAIEEEAITLSVYYYCVFRCCCCSFYPSLCRLSRFLLSYVAVSRSCRLSVF